MPGLRASARATCGGGLLPAALLAALLLCGCARAGESGAGGAGSLPRLEELLTIGCGECEGLEQLAPIGVSLSAQHLIVVDQHEPVVRVFAFDGSVVSAFGIHGQGPGELELGVAALPVGEDTLLVYDLMGVKEFNIHGEYRRTMSWSPRLPHSFDFAGDRRELYMIASPPPTENAVSSLEETASLLRWRLDEPSLEAELLIAGNELPRDPDDWRAVGSRVVGADPRGGFVIGEAWGYELVRYDTEGKVLYRTHLDRARPLRTEEELEAARRFNESLRARGLDPPVPSEEAPHFGSHGLRVDETGRLWVLGREHEGAGSLLDLFADDGGYIGGMPLGGQVPGGYALWDVHAGRLAAAVPGDDGNTVVRLWRVVD